MDKRIVDLSVTLGGPDFVGPAFFPPIVFEAIHTHENRGKSNTKLSYPVHVGTHADAPYYALPGAPPIDEAPLENFIGDAVIIDVRDFIKPLSGLTLAQFEASLPAGVQLQNKIVVLHSGWLKKKYGSREYYDQYPYAAQKPRREKAPTRPCRGETNSWWT